MKGLLSVALSCIAMGFGCLCAQAPPPEDAATVEVAGLLAKDAGQSQWAAEVLLAERQRLIRALVNIVDDAKLREEKPSAVYQATRVLGEFRAVAAVPALLELVTYDPDNPPGTPRVLGLWRDATTQYPAVAALIRIGVAARRAVLREIPGTDGRSRKMESYVSVVVGVEGPQVADYLLADLLQKQTDANARQNVQYALDYLRGRKWGAPTAVESE